MPKTTVLLFDRGGRDLVSRARTACAKAVVESLRKLPEVSTIVVATAEPQEWRDFPCVLEEDPPGNWHFGARFGELIERYRQSASFIWQAAQVPFFRRRTGKSFWARSFPSPTPS